MFIGLTEMQQVTLCSSISSRSNSKFILYTVAPKDKTVNFLKQLLQICLQMFPYWSSIYFSTTLLLFSGICSAMYIIGEKRKYLVRLFGCKTLRVCYVRRFRRVQIANTLYNSCVLDICMYIFLLFHPGINSF